jgi:N-acetylmuramoyl-L-alanine amidase
VRLYRLGDEGEPVRDIQQRLTALGHLLDNDEPAVFGRGTARAVAAFQRDRGLAPDGIVGADTWRTLVDAGFTLGDRMLYHRVPMMRGDDVSVLQRRLNALGFDAGKVDGTFGPDTLRALLDFQANRRMAEDGIAGAEVVAELELMARATRKDGRQAVRERQWLASLPTHLVGQRVYVDAFCRSEDEAAGCWEAAVEFATAIQRLGGHPVLSRSADTFPDEQVRALRANRMGADFVVAFATPRDGEAAVFYFASTYSHSAAGEKIAAAVAHSVGLLATGRSVPMLQDTRQPAIIVAKEPMDASVGRATAEGIRTLLYEG